MSGGADRAPARFAVRSRVLHWLMAAMVLAMLFIGVGMVTSLVDYHWLVSVHRPLGIAILLVVVVRVVNRRFSKLPAFPETMSAFERGVAHYTEWLMYGLFFVMPVVGWAMLSAGSYPIVMFGRVHLPRIAPAEPTLYTVLRRAHTVLAYLFFVVILAHVGAVAFHTLVVRDGMLSRMAFWPSRRRATPAAVDETEPTPPTALGDRPETASTD